MFIFLIKFQRFLFSKVLFSELDRYSGGNQRTTIGSISPRTLLVSLECLRMSSLVLSLIRIASTYACLSCLTSLVYPVDQISSEPENKWRKRTVKDHVS
jgi:hypothetical protein